MLYDLAALTAAFQRRGEQPHFAFRNSSPRSDCFQLLATWRSPLRAGCSGDTARGLELALKGTLVGACDVEHDWNCSRRFLHLRGDGTPRATKNGSHLYHMGSFCSLIWILHSRRDVVLDQNNRNWPCHVRNIA